ncbi:biotin transporter BioY [Mycetocola reblochoni]|uniref:Biotin transporter n=2 Tax=Mycetocola reblochoni TaxID=331618 RepID=A0A1R4J5A2_9MICO|nr:biotin transporter BioY [Mycetocola reblochoni]RLP69566.1 biotin transporter BioY [Mycetocola reblochoni]SJN27228.1 Substrate-specific component BioY of biotin ECF transporter [Mycetocola reblochoni REB411]
MSYAPALTRPVLADVLVRNRSLVSDVALVGAGAALVALLAQVEVPMFPVPITGQTLGVVLVGAALGAKRGAIAMTTYMLLAVAGAPVLAGFSGGPASVLLPSFGFVLGFIPAAAIAGWFAERRWDRSLGWGFLGFIAASVVPFLVGVPYMMLILSTVFGTPVGLGGAIEMGVLPFVIGGVVKAALAAALLPLAWRGVAALDRDSE